VISSVGQLVFYFGTIGVASILAWFVAAGLIVLYIIGLRRSSVCWTALAVAIGGLVLANTNSNQISAIQIDFSDEIQAAKQRMEPEEGSEDADADEASTENLNGEDVSTEPTATESEGVAGVERSEPPAENAPSDASDAPAGEETGDSPRVPRSSPPATPDLPNESGTDNEAVDEPLSDDEVSDDEPTDAGNPSRYAYRQQGKVERAAGMAVEVKDKIAVEAGVQDQPVIANVRVMKTEQVAEANRLDRLNLFFARLTLTLAVLVVAVDYLRRFNMTFRSLFPLPVGGSLVDSFFPKTHAVCVDAGGRRRWKRFLKRVVRKGETFIYFGDQDPFTASRLGRLPLLPRFLWPLNKITRLANDREFDDEFLFESAWFGRYCFVILDDGQQAAGMLAALAEFLRLRHASRATARHTVNVVWNLAAAPPEPTLQRLATLCPETNFKLLVATNRQLTETQRSYFDEIVA